MGLSSENLEIIIDKAKFRIRPCIVDWISYDLILRKQWLTNVNSLINWTQNKTRISNNNQIITLDAKSRKHGASLPTTILTCKQFLRLAKKKKSTCYHVHLKPSGAENFDGEHSKSIEELLLKYEGVFPEKLPPGLPPKRNVEMSINLEEGAKP